MGSDVHRRRTNRSTYSVKTRSNGLLLGALLMIILTIKQVSILDVGSLPDSQIDIAHRSVTGHRVDFVLFLGIEGTGHHFWQDLIKESSIFTDIQQAGLHPELTTQLTKHLYRHKRQRWRGLWSSPCKWEASDPSPNVTQIQDDLASTLREMNKKVGQKFGPNRKLVIPVNLLPVANGNEFGVVSYPGFLKPCRPLQYPELRVWYDTCSKAAASCHHVYITREPYAVVKSTTVNRQFNSDKLEAIHLYTTELRVLHSQLMSFPDRLVACWDYDEAKSLNHWRQEIEPMLGFQNQSNFESAIQKTYHRNPSPPASKEEIVPAEFQPYMDSLLDVHDTLTKTCNRLTELRRAAL